VPPPKPTIAKISIFSEDSENGRGLGIDQGEKTRIKKAVTFAIKHILGWQAPFCEHEEAKLRRALDSIEEREPRLAGSESSCGACSLLSRALDVRCPRRPRMASLAAGAGEAGTAAGDGDGDGDDAKKRDGDMPPAQRIVG